MKSLDIAYSNIDNKLSLEDISNKLDSVEPVDINVINWEEYSYLPETKFHILYSNYAVYIKYVVVEENVLARKQETNDQVFKDSCVEFFISPGDGLYHNYEFNAIGTFLAGAQRGRGEGSLKKSDIKVRTFSTLGKEPFGKKEGITNWELTVEIPFDTFTNKSIEEIKGSSMKANLYKCGDETDTPHFVTWNNIDTENPDFHRPECFGVINFK